MSNPDSTMELLSLNVSQRILEILYAVDSDESAMRMEESITTFILASTRLSLSTRLLRSITLELTEISNRFVELHTRSSIMSARMETSDLTTGSHQQRLAHVTGLIQISGLISSAATLKNHFCQRYVSRLQEIGCYPISASSSTPIFITPRRNRNTRPRLSLWRENAILRSPSGRIRQPLGTVDPRGTYASLCGDTSHNDSLLGVLAHPASHPPVYGGAPAPPSTGGLSLT
ncbi:hypothetical protein [bubaline-associated gemykrogvirus]|nr:hypothetical protein [bubaline-associated gemykrogvirus]